LAEIFDPEPVEGLLSYKFKNPELLKQALTHPSVLDESRKTRRGGNDLLATVGDAVIDLAVAAHLYGNSGPTGPFLTSAKGDLTSKRSEFVNDNRLAEFYEKTQLTQHLRTSAGQKQVGLTPRMLAQAYEAIVGAIFLDADYEMAKQIVRRTMFPPDISRDPASVRKEPDSVHPE